MAAENRSYTLEDMVNNAIICTLGAKKLSDGTVMSNAPDFSKEVEGIDANHLRTLRDAYNSRMKKGLEDLLREYFTDNLDAVIKEGKYSNAMVKGTKGAWKPFPAETFEYMLKDGAKAAGNGAAAIAIGARAGVYGLVTAEEKAKERENAPDYGIGADYLYGKYGGILKTVNIKKDDVQHYITESGILSESKFLESLNGDARNLQYRKGAAYLFSKYGGFSSITQDDYYDYIRTNRISGPEEFLKRINNEPGNIPAMMANARWEVARPAAKGPVPTKVITFNDIVIHAGGGAAAGISEDQRVLMQLAAVIGENITAGGKTFYSDIYKDFVIRNLGSKNLYRLRNALTSGDDRKALFEFLYMKGAGPAAYNELKGMMHKNPGDDVALAKAYDVALARDIRNSVALYARNAQRAMSRYGREYIAGTAELAHEKGIVPARRAVSANAIAFTEIAKGARLEGRSIVVDFNEALGRRKSVLQMIMPWNKPNRSRLTIELDARPSAMSQSDLSSETNKIYEFAMGNNTLYVDINTRDSMGKSVGVTITLRPNRGEVKVNEMRRVSFTVSPDGIVDPNDLNRLKTITGVKFLGIENNGKKTVQYATSVKAAIAETQRKEKTIN